MKTYLSYGLYLALALLLLNVALFAAGLHTDASKLQTAQIISTCASIIISVLFIYLGAKAREALVPADKPFGYGQALLAGWLVAIFAGLIGIVTTYVYMQLINPSYIELTVQNEIAKLEAKGLATETIEGAEKAIRFMMKPAILSITGFLSAIFFGLIVSLITAIFARRKDQPPVIA